MFISKHKNGRYYIYYVEPLTGKRKSISARTRLKSEANNFLSNLREELKERSERRVIEITLEDFRFEFLKHSEGIHTYHSTRAFKNTFRFILEHLGNINLHEITKQMVMDYIQNRIRTASTYQARKDLINLSSAFNWGIERLYLHTNPTDGIKRIKVPEKQPLFFRESEFEKLMINIKHPDLRDLVEFAVNTGLRQMEIITLEWDRINFDEEYLTLDNRSHLTKSKRIRTVPLNDAALEILNKRLLGNRGDLVFTYANRLIKPSFIQKQFKKAVRKAKINDRLCFHSLRHSFASWLVQKGTPIYVIKELLGHQSISTTEIYSHLRSEDLRNAVKLINKR